MYDALNVLMAMNIISKEKKEIKWIGLPTNSAQECQSLEVAGRHPGVLGGPWGDGIAMLLRVVTWGRYPLRLGLWGF